MKTQRNRMVMAILVVTALLGLSGVHNALAAKAFVSAFQLACTSATNELRSIAPEAKVQMVDRAISLTHRLRLHKSDPSQGDGKPARNQSEIVGPERDGYFVFFRIRSGIYEEKAVRGKSPHIDKRTARKEGEFYATTSLMEFREQDCYVVAEIQFGEDSNLEKVSRIFQVLSRSIEAHVRKLKN